MDGTKAATGNAVAILPALSTDVNGNFTNIFAIGSSGGDGWPEPRLGKPGAPSGMEFFGTVRRAVITVKDGRYYRTRLWRGSRLWVAGPAWARCLAREWR